jgi:hypothetical protein
MRPALIIPIGLGLALALAPGRASADAPRVELRLEYVRGAGGEACPAEPTTLRAEVAARMGYDPFEGTSAPERLAVVMMAKGHGFAARVERFNAAGVNTWSETFSTRALQGGCAALMSPLASYLRALFLTYQGGPATPPAAPPPEPAAPRPEPAAPAPSRPAASPPELRAPPIQPANPPEPLNVPNPKRTTARNVAIVAYSVGAVFLGLGIRWSVVAQSKTNTAQTLSGQVLRSGGGPTGCTAGTVSDASCDRVLGAWQSRDAALNLRNGWFAAAGVSVAVGVVATAWALDLPPMIKGQPQTQVSLRPGGLVFSGAF